MKPFDILRLVAEYCCNTVTGCKKKSYKVSTYKISQLEVFNTYKIIVQDNIVDITHNTVQFSSIDQLGTCL